MRASKLGSIQFYAIISFLETTNTFRALATEQVKKHQFYIFNATLFILPYYYIPNIPISIFYFYMQLFYLSPLLSFFLCQTHTL